MIQPVLVAFNDTDNRAYAYAWRYNEADDREQPLKVGDKVKVPPNWVSTEGATVTVVGYGYGAFQGHLVEIECRA